MQFMSLYDVYGNKLFDSDSVIKTNIANSLRSKAYLKRLLSESGGSMQGACTDGEYIYYVYYTTNTLKKYNISTGEVTSSTYSSGLLGHANDMTYNPLTNKIYVTVMDDDAHIAIINPATLNIESQFVLYGSGGTPLQCHGIAYDRIHNTYLIAHATVVPGTYGQRYSIFDANFDYISTFESPAPETYTIQGIETDGYFVYRVVWNSNTNNFVKVYDFDGNYIKEILVASTDEMETLMNDWQGNWYCDFNTSSGGALSVCGIKCIPYESIDADI